MKPIIALGLVLLSLFACKPAEIAINPALQAEAMSVKGRNGLQIGQIIRYGEYQTDKVRRGWTKSYDVPFLLRFRGAKEKLSYTQFGPNGLQAEVACVSKFKSVELPLLRDYFSIPLDLDNFFAGNIAFGDGESNWDFLLHNPNGDFLRKEASAGFVQSAAGKRFEIVAVRGLKGQPDWMKELAVYGHEFHLDGRVVAAVSTVNKGTVWIDPELDGELKTVVAAVATGLLLRTGVEETAVDSLDS
ncbi:MAG: hypothetical protein KDC43_20230 [Saprospiraceae bacterium]|nr:hypothetical protein [Saprospiraceae bacterium]